ncbi:MAG TPA: thioredoxin-dependent thiol peroxidase [Gemmatimonadaceae bacterium]|nr:thioredoxin-dependent thiol peroxidase [Gemmatimonadaceae bacterium]
MSAPKVGAAAPDFTVETDEGKTVSLSDFRGKPVVLYFYPKDDTPGCTREACDFRDAFPRFTKGKAVILGVSPDTVKSHAKFKKNYDLPFTLLADVDKSIAKAYRVWRPKKFMGREFLGVVRTTFVIDAKGVIRNVFEVKKVAGHVEAVESAISELR